MVPSQMQSQRSSEIKKSASRWIPETERGTHRFEITNYSLLDAYVPDDYIQSATFTVGDNDWRIKYMPNGGGPKPEDEDDDDEDDDTDFVSVYLQRLHKTTVVKALTDIRLINTETGFSLLACSFAGAFNDEHTSWGARNFYEKSSIKESFVRADCLVIECEVTVIKGTPVSETVCQIQVPPSDVLDRLGNLLGDEKLADVKFKVAGEVFRAHKFVVAMRSPVFEAVLYGPMRDRKTKTMVIEDMQPAVFRGMLHFVYKDSLPAMDDLDKDEAREMVKHLLVAADRYGIERMKVLCESVLCNALDAENVVATLMLADRHHCSQLKDACAGFIKSANMIVDLVTSPAYAHLKRACPDVVAELCGQSAKSRKNSI